MTEMLPQWHVERIEVVVAAIASKDWERLCDDYRCVEASYKGLSCSDVAGYPVMSRPTH